MHARTRGVTVGRAFGARIVIAPSTLLFVAVLAALYGLSGTVTGDGFILGAALAVLILASVLVHEWCHALAARGFGREVEEIVLTFLGGHTQFRAAHERPLEMGVIALAGPAANALIGGLALAAPVDGLAGRIIGSVGVFNLLLAGFNALPGSPLDGGRVVAAIVWAATGNRWTGYRWAAYGGRLVAVGIVLVGLGGPLLRGAVPDPITLVWSLLLFSVVWTGASAELRDIAVVRRRKGVSGAALTRSAVLVDATATVAQTLERATAAGVDHAIVMSTDGHPAGQVVLALAHEVPADQRDSTSVIAITMPLTRGAVVAAGLDGEELIGAISPWVGTADTVVVADAGGPRGVIAISDLAAELRGEARPRTGWARGGSSR